MSERKTIALTTPGLTAHGEPITELKLRIDVVAGDLRAVRDMDSPFGMMLDLAAKLSDVPPSTIDKLNAEDTMKVVSEVAGFLGVSPEIGGMSLAISPGSSTSPQAKSGE